VDLSFFKQLQPGQTIVETPRCHVVLMSEEHIDGLVPVLIEPEGKELSTWGYFHPDTAKCMRPRDGVTAREVVSDFVKSALAEFEAGKRVPAVIIDKDTGKVAGIVMVLDIIDKHERCTLGFAITGPEHRGQGMMAEVFIYLIDWVFRNGFFRVQADVSKENSYSVQALAGAGLEIEGCRRKHMIVAFSHEDGTQQRHDMLLMGLLAEDWPGALHQMELLKQDSTNG
jgi:RimJ/RimL family protein N-acetyltransferase